MGIKVTMFEYCKMILEKLSFDRRLFRKEYKKSFKYLAPAERAAFRKWVRERFGAGTLRLQNAGQNNG
jgi:hypothetical protein